MNFSRRRRRRQELVPRDGYLHLGRGRARPVRARLGRRDRRDGHGLQRVRARRVGAGHQIGGASPRRPQGVGRSAVTRPLGVSYNGGPSAEDGSRPALPPIGAAYRLANFLSSHPSSRRTRRSPASPARATARRRAGPGSWPPARPSSRQLVDLLAALASGCRRPCAGRSNDWTRCASRTRTPGRLFCAARAAAVAAPCRTNP